MSRPIPIGAGHERFARRLLLVAAVALVLGAGLLARFVWLQIVEAPYYGALALGNRTRTVPLAPTRGIIYDRNGVVLAENIPTYEITLTPDQVTNVAAALARLGRIIPISAQDRDNFRKLRATKKNFQPVPVKTDLTPAEVARFAVNRQDFPGLDVTATLKRYYPPGTDATDVVGYVGLMSNEDLKRLDANEYAASARVGKIGVEWQYERLLHGSIGYQKVEVNAVGRAIRVLATRQPRPGEDLYLTIDTRLQRIAYRALGARAGAVVAIQPASGAVLCMVSKPAFDPNLFVTGISQKDYDALLSRPGDPLVNRALRGRYAPGSTIKPFLGLAALYYGVLTPATRLFAGPTFRLPNYSHVFHDWNPYQSGYETLEQALIRSTDTFFYQVAQRLGIQRMHDFLAHFGFGEKPPIDLPGALAGTNPSPAWKRATYGKPWYRGETINNGIGQGYFQITPLQLAWATAVLAARGKRYPPHVLGASAIPGSDKRTDYAGDPLAPLRLPERADWKYVVHALHEVVANPRGTAHGIAKGLDFPLAGKTGTAQVTSIYHSDFAKEENIPLKQRDNALFIGFAPVQNPQIAVAVIVEHGGGGSSAAAPIARKIIAAWIHRNDPAGKTHDDAQPSH
ncbi:MAG TPA: penicillin-binding protein 2 [Gammaproteobacteria bacterium]|nr:penicillin-binding protein 2 [Gammaproteobacteria bacterium]